MKIGERNSTTQKRASSSRRRLSASFKVGAIALVFLIIGYQVALFVRQSAMDIVTAHRDAPDTVYIVASPESEGCPVKPCASSSHPTGSGVQKKVIASSASPSSDHGRTNGSSRAQSKTKAQPYDTVRRDSEHSEQAQRLRLSAKGPADPKSSGKRPTESFAFDPNTVSIDELQRLGFSLKQAQSIDNYRLKGGRFRRKSDFARSYVVSDSIYQRLEPYIDIPLIDINEADSAAFDALPGIGGYFASKMVEYRERLHGYSYPEQLMDIYRFDEQRYDSIKDLITVSLRAPYPLWTLPEDSLRLHPYIGYSAHSVVLYRQNTPPERRSVMDLKDALKPGMAEKLSRCYLE